MDRMTAQAIKAVDDNQVRVLTGTVYSATQDATALMVTLDNNLDPGTITTPVTIPSICGPLPVGTRVTVLVMPPSGMIVIGVINQQTSMPARDQWEFSILRRAYTDTVTPATWDKPLSPLFYGVEVMLQGGGGGSGGTADNASGAARTSCSGGGQGGYFLEVYIPAANLTDTCTVTVGAGGTAAAAGNNAGGTGGTSSFTDDAAVDYATAPGGAGGSGGGVSGTSAHTTQNGGSGTQVPTIDNTRAFSIDFQQGGDGGTGFRYLNPDPALINPGFGGECRLAGITRISGRDNSVGGLGQIAPSNGYAFGGGASGRGVASMATLNFSAGGGAAGGQGIVIVKELYRV